MGKLKALGGVDGGGVGGGVVVGWWCRGRHARQRNWVWWAERVLRPLQRKWIHPQPWHHTLDDFPNRRLQGLHFRGRDGPGLGSMPARSRSISESMQKTQRSLPSRGVGPGLGSMPAWRRRERRRLAGAGRSVTKTRRVPSDRDLPAVCSTWCWSSSLRLSEGLQRRWRRQGMSAGLTKVVWFECRC